MGAEAKNLEAISKAIDQHNDNCPLPAVEVRMNPFEVERLDWDEIRGLPIKADPKIGTGRFRVVCAGEKSPGSEIEETVAEDGSGQEVKEVDREGELLKIG